MSGVCTSKYVLLILSGVFFTGNTCAISQAATLHVDSFQAGSTMGWQGKDPSPRWQATGGPEGVGDAFIVAFSDGSVNLATRNSRPDWTGNYQAIGATSVSVDMMMTAPSVNDLDIRLVLFGPADVTNRWTSRSPVIVPNDGIWRNYQFSLAQADLRRVLGVSDYDDLITDVVRIMLRYDPGAASAQGTTVNAMLGIDNVQLVGRNVTPGDYNGDGSVGPPDYEVWKVNYAAEVEPQSGADGNGDGRVSAADYTVWRDNLNNAESGFAALQIPEPASLLLALFAFGIRIAIHRANDRHFQPQAARLGRRHSSSLICI